MKLEKNNNKTFVEYENARGGKTYTGASRFIKRITLEQRLDLNEQDRKEIEDIGYEEFFTNLSVQKRKEILKNEIPDLAEDES